MEIEDTINAQRLIPENKNSTYRLPTTSATAGANSRRKKSKTTEELAYELKFAQKSKEDLWKYAFTGPKFRRDLVCILEMPFLTWEEQKCKKALQQAERKRDRAAKKSKRAGKPCISDREDIQKALRGINSSEPTAIQAAQKGRDEVLSSALRSTNPYRSEQEAARPRSRDSVEKMSPLTCTTFRAARPIPSKAQSSSDPAQNKIWKDSSRATRMTDFILHDVPSLPPPVPLKDVEAGYAPAAKPSIPLKLETFRCDICGSQAVAGYDNMKGSLRFCPSCYEPPTPIELPPSPKFAPRESSKPVKTDILAPLDADPVLPRTHFRSPLSVMVNQTQTLANETHGAGSGLLSMWMNDLIDEDDPIYNPPTPAKYLESQKSMLSPPRLPSIEPTSPLRPNWKKRVASSVYPEDEYSALSTVPERPLPPIPDKFRQEWQKGNKRSIFHHDSPFASLGEAGMRAVNDLLADRDGNRTTYYGLLEDYISKGDDDHYLEDSLKANID